jgi:UPF0755 protein
MQKIALLLVAVGILVALSAAALVYYALTPISTSPDEVRFVVARGQSISAIGAKLTTEGFIRHPLIFRAVVKAKGLEQLIQAGSFKLAKNQTPWQIATALTQGTDDLWITIPEGWRREEIAKYLSEQELSEFDEDEFLELTSASEGKLFPETYLVSREVTAKGIYDLLTNTFERKVVDGLSEEIEQSGHTLDEILIMASLLEREGNTPAQLNHIAGILWHRIDIGMALQVDASLQYVKGYDAKTKSWWVPPLAADKQLDSPFNTYAHPGLPPRPIANPGLDAIKAAATPDRVTDLFYIHDSSGQMHFAKTLEEHNRNVERYLR